MAVDMNKAIDWAVGKVGAFTYSMYGSRTGADGTADCSGFVYTAIRNGGGSKYGFVPSTETLHDYLTKNGFKLIAENTSRNMQRGDVVIWGKKGQSAGAGGHTGICIDNQRWVECTAWSGAGANGGVVVANHDNRLAMAGYPYWYVYRQVGGSKPSPAPKPPKPANANQAHDQAVAASKPKQDGNYIAKLDVFHEEPKGQARAGGWMVAVKGAPAYRYGFVFFMEHGTDKELARVMSKGIPRPDVSKAYGLPTTNNYGLDATVPFAKLKGKKVDIMFRRTNDPAGNTKGGAHDVRLSDIYLTIPK